MSMLDAAFAQQFSNILIISAAATFLLHTVCFTS